MKKIGIIFAMDEELVSLKKYLNIIKEYEIFNLKFYEGNYKDIYFVLVLSGVGKVNAARTTQILIDNLKVDFIFNIGVAGGISSTLNVGDIVIGERLVQHDFDITAFNHKKSYIPNVGDYIDADSFLLNLTKNINIKEINIRYGTIASGDIFCTEKEMANKINKKFNALCVEMEGASVAQVCYLCNVPFLILRSISDVPNNDNVITYEKFLEKATENISLIMLNLLDNLNEYDLR